MALLGKVSICVRGEEWGDIHDEYHLLLELPVLIVLWTHLPIEVKQLFELLVLGGHDILYDRHQERWLEQHHSISIAVICMSAPGSIPEGSH
jgi:hypothetical protein